MQGALRWIFRILCVGLACLLIFLLVRYQKTERAHDAHIAELHKQAAAYEARLKEIENELAAARAADGDGDRAGAIMIAFQIGSDADLTRVTGEAQQYGFEPVIVLDAQTQDAERLARAAAQSGYEVVLTAMPFSAEAAQQAAAIRARLAEEAESADSGVFLLRESYETEEALSLLTEAGFGGCVCYYTHETFSAAHPDFLLMRYSFLRDETFSVEKRLQAMSDGGEALMFVFDFASGDLAPEAAERFLSAICASAEGALMQISTVAQTCDAIRQSRVNAADGQAAYEKLLTERQAEIDALRAKLNEIYSNWKGEEAA